ncbi:MAG: hypothetical protein MSG64_08025 [Pyrinomonadaceae bacterium MAG19_C2-C3]|nr:hypothetical protein [Pyrinomonadaceae bacterium MAG19_C2-C3]
MFDLPNLRSRAALPPDVRKGFAFPSRPRNLWRLRRPRSRHSLEDIHTLDGEAAASPHIRRQSRETSSVA